MERRLDVIFVSFNFSCRDPKSFVLVIYSLGAQHFHASAGVLIADEITPLQLMTLTRILAHNKKALMVATTSGKDSEDVKIVTMKTYFLERDVSQMSNRANDLYDVVVENKID